LHTAVGIGEPAIVGGDHVAALLGRYDLPEFLECLGEQPAAARLVEPYELLPAQQEDAAQDEVSGALGVGLGIGQGQCGAPGPAEQLPAVYTQMDAQPLYVGHEVPGGVGFKAGVGQRPPAAALVKEDDPIALGVVVASHGRIAATA